MLSDIGIELLKIDALRSLEHVRELEAKRNRALAELDRPQEKLFFTTAEHEAALAAAAPKATPEKPKYNWFRLGQDQPPADDGFDSDAAYEKLRASLPPPKTAYSRGYNAGLAIGFLTFDGRCRAQHERERARREAHAATPSGRREAAAEAAWISMLTKSKQLLDKGGAAALMAEKPPAPAAPVVVATSEGILRAYGIAKGTVVEMPSDPAARAIVKAAARRRGEEDKP